MVESEDSWCQKSPGGYQYCCVHPSSGCKQIKKALGYGGFGRTSWFSRERKGAPVLWLSCEGQIDVWELFSDNSYLSGGLDRQGLLVAASVDLHRKLFTKTLTGFWSKLKEKKPKIFVMFPTITSKKSKQKKSYDDSTICAWQWQNIKFFVKNIFLLWHQNQERSGDWIRYNVFRRDITVNGPFCVLHNLGNLLPSHESVPHSRKHVVPAEWQFRTVEASEPHIDHHDSPSDEQLTEN